MKAIVSFVCNLTHKQGHIYNARDVLCLMNVLAMDNFKFWNNHNFHITYQNKVLYSFVHEAFYSYQEDNVSHQNNHNKALVVL